MLTVGSLFSGVGGIDLGLERAGMRIAFQCEIDPSAQRVLRRHWPDMPLFSDVSEVNSERSANVDVLCGGFPCQDLSVAGRRAGLAGERSGLFFEFVRVAAALTPRWVLIENVPGLLSSDDGRDMGIVLGQLADLGYGWCYRVLDARYFGVAQRRRRVFIVGCLGDQRRAGQILLESESCDGDLAPRRKEGQEVAGTLGSSSNNRGWSDDTDRMTFIPTVSSKWAKGSGGPSGDEAQNLVTAFMWQAAGNTTASGAFEDDLSPTMPRHQTVAVAYPLAMRGRDDGAELEMGDEGLYNALRAGDGGSSRQNLVMAFSENQRAEVVETEIAHQLTVRGGKPGQGYSAVRDGIAVRRLMPVECERLQGLPDGWTEGESDSARYRLLGNSVAVPCIEWIGRRMVNA